jgi:hypothetical protein
MEGGAITSMSDHYEHLWSREVAKAFDLAVRWWNVFGVHGDYGRE